MIHKYQVYIFPKGKQSKIHMTKFVLACRESKKVVDDHTNHQGASMVFLVMNSIDTWKSPRVMRTTTNHVKRLYTMPSNSDDIDERDGEQKGIQCSRLTATQNLWIGKNR